MDINRIIALVCQHGKHLPDPLLHSLTLGNSRFIVVIRLAVDADVVDVVPQCVVAGNAVLTAKVKLGVDAQHPQHIRNT